MVQEQGKELIEMSTWLQEQGKEVIEISTWQEQGKEVIEMSTWCKNKERKSLRCPRGWNKEQGTHWKNANTIGNIPSRFPVVFLQFGFQYVILCNPIQ